MGHGGPNSPDVSAAAGHAQQIAAARRMATLQLLRQARHLALGRRLLPSPEAKAAWLESLGMQPGQAALLLRVDELWGATENADQLDAAAMLVLAGPHVPAAAIWNAADLARRGHAVTVERARQLIARHTPPIKGSA